MERLQNNCKSYARKIVYKNPCNFLFQGGEQTSMLCVQTSGGWAKQMYLYLYTQHRPQGNYPPCAYFLAKEGSQSLMLHFGVTLINMDQPCINFD